MSKEERQKQYQQEYRNRKKAKQVVEAHERNLSESLSSFNHNICAPRNLFDNFKESVTKLQTARDFVGIGRLINNNTVVEKIYVTTCTRANNNDSGSAHIAVTSKGAGKHGVVSLFA